MGEFFRGWRRKTGVVTLVFACLQLGHWLNCLHSGKVLTGYAQDRYSERWIDSQGAIVVERIESDCRVVFDAQSPEVMMVTDEGPSPTVRFKHNANSEYPKIPRAVVLSVVRVEDKPNPAGEIPPRYTSHVSMVQDQVVDWKWSLLGFGYGVSDSRSLGQHANTNGPVVRMTVWRFPYWSIVIPLTLISAFLLLSKPHKSNQEKITEPIPNKGT